MKEQEIIDILRGKNPEFKQLEDEHRALEDRLLDLGSKHFLATEEEMEIKKIKKQKLVKKDKMAEIIRTFKKMGAMTEL